MNIEKDMSDGDLQFEEQLKGIRPTPMPYGWHRLAFEAGVRSGQHRAKLAFVRSVTVGMFVSAMSFGAGYAFRFERNIATNPAAIASADKLESQHEVIRMEKDRMENEENKVPAFREVHLSSSEMRSGSLLRRWTNREFSSLGEFLLDSDIVDAETENHSSATLPIERDWRVGDFKELLKGIL